MKTKALTCEQAAGLIAAWDDILILCHANPDGDTLGCAAGLLRGLVSLGKRAAFRCADAVPRRFAGLFSGLPQSDFPPAHILSVDVADEALLGSLREEYSGKIELAIDHHASHRPFASATWLEGDSAAAAEMIWLLLLALGVTPDRAMAEAVYTGVATDTGCFRYQNTTPRSHEIAAACMALGIDAAGINRLHFETKSRAQFAAEQKILAGMEFFAQGKGCLIRQPLSILAETGALPEELDGTISAMSRQIEGVLLGILLKEREGEIKVSLRANPPANASALAAKFGGGGHPGAAGCSFSGASLEEAARQMRQAAEEYLMQIRN